MVWKSHGFKTTEMFCYTVSAVCAIFFVPSKMESAGLPQLYAVSHTAPPPPVGARLRAVSESHLCV